MRHAAPTRRPDSLDRVRIIAAAVLIGRRLDPGSGVDLERIGHRAKPSCPPNGVIIAKYTRARGVKSGSFLELKRQSGSDRGSPNQRSTLLSKRVKAPIRSPVSVRTKRPLPWRMPPVAARR